jgi:hypothetical protein
VIAVHGRHGALECAHCKAAGWGEALMPILRIQHAVMKNPQAWIVERIE